MEHIQGLLNSVFSSFGFFETIILLGELTFCLDQKLRRHGALTLIVLGALYIIIPRLVPGFHQQVFFYIGPWFTYAYLLMFLLSIVILWVSFEVTLTQAMFYGVSAYTMQHLWFNLFSVLSIATGWEYESFYMNCYNFFANLMVLAIEYFMLARHIRRSGGANLNNGVLTVFSLGAILVINVLNLWAIGRDEQTMVGHVYAASACILLLVVLFGYFDRNELFYEKKLMERLLAQSEQKYRQSMENAEAIGRKCHDLKHQIAALRSMDVPQRDTYVDELERAVMIYESIHNTGSDTLNVLLNEKQLICEQSGIQMTVVADASALSFMDPVDLYTLFGNAIDNAIESAVQEPDPNARFITLRIASRGSLLSICLENTCVGNPAFVDGVPQTTKSDKENHGYGVKSIRILVEKYNGTMSMEQADNKFIFNALFSGV